MESLIKGYEYDIFISYRQKDNKGDRWVSKFVESLKTELEATFKEDVSVYFDENPHDRLQETHNVDKSLEGKLRCLIFIPILSQTYCDPSSYAWQYEFLAFLRMTEKDHFGKDIRLRSGNVGSRVLPIRIHDLEPEDLKLFEKETGSVLRALDFVFKTSTGVSRPLKDNEDHPQDNLNKTFYSDQINKVGHAIKEIILGMKKEPEQVIKEKVERKEFPQEGSSVVPEKSAKPSKLKILFSVTFIGILVIAVILIYPKIFKKSTFDKLRYSGEKISIVVIPFQNMTNDTIWNIWQDGIQDNLINSLSSTEELKVWQTESINSLIQSKGLKNYSSLSASTASMISKKLNANFFICGSIKQAGPTIRLNAQLIDSKTEEILKPFQIEATKEQMNFGLVDSLSMMVKNFLIISKLVKKEPLDAQLLASTNSPEAYRYFTFGQKAYLNLDFSNAVKWYSQAVEKDSNFIFAILRLSYAYSSLGLFDQAKKWCLKAYSKRDQMTFLQRSFLNYIYAVNFETPFERIEYSKRAIEIDDQLPMFYYFLGLTYNELSQYDKAIPEFKKALEVYERWGLKPMWVLNYTYLGIAYHRTNQYKKEKQLYKKAEKDFPDNYRLIYFQAILSLTEKDTVKANEYIQKYKTISRGIGSSEADITTSVAAIYSEADILNKAEEHYRKALALEPENQNRINTLAYFLINKEINTVEGLKLVEKALEISPENYSFLDTKGWGLFKQGKNNEALELLEKSWKFKPRYIHRTYLHIQEVKKAVAEQK
jgi:tetratricopeptide (TPR) repeat protein